ncbi:MAG: glycoside hydrolase family 43 protein [Tannerella sp.]|jgi:beta-xylosidase|nr:glycoside hydrolase family 43 protein [Tannerella sp.]
MKIYRFLLIWIYVSISLSAQQTYRNPVIAGDFPDPSVIRVGDTYFAAATSSEWAPPYRLYESKDLVNWQYLGGLFKDMPSWTMGSYWAPELYYHDGTYFVYYTARRKSDRKSFIGVATTRNIREGFTDRGVIVEWTNEAIDAFVVESNGERYITWKAYGLDRGKTIEILGAKLSEDGLKLAGEAFTLLVADRENWEAGGIEGQCLFEHDGYIYMLYSGNACCGRNCNYQIGVARAHSIEGPWEKYAGNPLMYGDDRFRCPGHGTLVETPDNRYFYLYHAYDAAVDVYLGRQGMLDEIVWDKATGWLSFRYGKTPSLQAETPVSTTVQQPLPAFTDPFSASGLRKEWTWDVSQPKPSATCAGNRLILRGNDTPMGSFLGLRPQKANYTFVAELPESNNGSAGVCIYGTSENGIGLSVENGNIELWQVKQGVRTVLASRPVESYPLSLCLKTQFGQYCRFGILKDNDFQPVGQVIMLNELPQWDRPALVGLQVRGEAEGVFSGVSLVWE